MTERTFTVEIDGTAALTVAPNDGFIEYLRIWEQVGFDTNVQETGGTIPTALANGLAKSRAFLRFQQLGKDLAELTTCIMSDMNYSDGSVPTLDDPPTKFAFTIVFYNDEYLKTEDEYNAGTILEDEDCIKRLISRSLSANRVHGFADVYDPTIQESNNPLGIRIMPLTIGSCFAGIDVEARITAIEAVTTIVEI